MEHRREERIGKRRVTESFLQSILSRIRMMQRRISYLLIRRDVPAYHNQSVRVIDGREKETDQAKAVSNFFESVILKMRTRNMAGINEMAFIHPVCSPMVSSIRACIPICREERQFLVLPNEKSD